MMERQYEHTPCPLAKKCGGCQMQNLPYARQLQVKQGKVNALMGRFCRVEPIIGMEEPVHYRNKVQAAFGTDAHGRIISGVYQSSSHRIVCVDDCMLEDTIADAIIVDIRKMLPRFRIAPFDERRRTGWLRHVLVKRSFRNGEVMVVLVAAAPIFRLQKPFLAELLEKHPEITTVILNVNDGFTSLVLGQKEKVLYGPGYIEDELCGKRFRISAKSFYQINPVQTEVLYNTAVSFAGLTGKERVLDAYCGTGTIGLVAGASAAEVAGVELNADAVRDAIANAKRNGVKNCWFTCADAGQFMTEMAGRGESCDVVFMDPPRAGSDKAFLTSLLQMAPKRVVYVSCNPETLARDVQVLVNGGYQVKKVQPVDMFPFTEHVETVCLLSKLSGAKHHVEVELNLDEMDLTSAESKATYEEIKAYVQEHAGLNVSKLYIAQTKRKYGIIERENYNLPKSEDSRQPQCPPEKEEAIKDALKHFGMI